MRSRSGLRVTYVVQNIGLDLDADVGIPVTVRYTLDALRNLGHVACLVHLTDGRSVGAVYDKSGPGDTRHLPLGLTGTPLVRFGESGVRWLQGRLRIPYFAFFDGWRTYEALYRHLPGFDICHEHNGLLTAGAALASARARVPYILTVDADPFLEREILRNPLRFPQAAVASWCARTTYRIARRIICFSEATRQRLVNVWRVEESKTEVVPLAADTERFGRQYDVSEARAELGLGDSPTVMFVGSFQQWHALVELAESFSTVVRAVPKAKLVLVGDGPGRQEIEQKVAELGITREVLFTGLVPHRDVPRMLAAADVVVAPYPRLLTELWFSPLKLYEYMAAGKAIVATRAGQIAETLTDGRTGVLVEPGDIQELAEALAALLRDPVKRAHLGARAQEQAIAHHSWDEYGRKLERIYQRVLEERANSTSAKETY